ncbi:MAG: LytR C-terminal domain-containing protein [Actinobacteria bacterium]|nr:LytR C-terminal domain-containing protein [Actinomycetota bacterium]
MSVPEGTRPRWPLRSAGFALLGLAAAAALTGVVLVVSDDGAAVGGGRRPGTSGQAPGSASARPSATPTLSSTPTATPSPTSRPAPASRPAVGAPVAPAPVAPAPGGPRPATPAPGTDSDVAASGKGDRRGEARVYNNSTISGLATQAAHDLTAAGWRVAEVGNYSGGRIWTTTVYYQEGTDQRATAEAIGTRFGMRVEPRFAGIAGARPGVIVIVTNDYGS